MNTPCYAREAIDTVGKHLISSRGFSRATRMKYYSQNREIAKYVFFENPSGTITTWFGLSPLYYPNAVDILEFGGIMEDCCPGAFRSLSKYDIKRGADNWVSNIIPLLETVALPFIDQLDTADKLLSYLKTEPSSFDARFHASQRARIELRMYTAAYLGDMDEANRAAQELLHLLLPNVIAHQTGMVDACRAFMMQINNPQFDWHAYFCSIIERNVAVRKCLKNISE